MKLRILGNKIRLRLTQHEVTSVVRGSAVTESVAFPVGDRLSYSISPSADAKSIQVAFNDHTIVVTVPLNDLSCWDEDMREGLYSSDGDIDISIEKDFKCLHKRPGEDETDNFPNPLENNG